MTGSIGRMFNRQSSVCREDSFTASQRNAAPLKAEDHRHLFAKPQRSASVPPPQRQMLDEYRESSLGTMPFSFICMRAGQGMH